jgi:arabinofuranosyltransferase
MISFINSNKWNLIILMLIVISTIFVHITHESWIWGIDDSMIYKTYMKNLSTFGEFVYNEEGERVEGFTSILWTLIGSLFYYINNNPSYLFIFFNILLVTIVLIKSLKLIEKKSFISDINPFEVKILFLMMIFLIPGFIEWNINSQLETGLWTFLLFFNFQSINKNQFFIFLLTGISMIFTRPESYIIFPILIILFTINSKRKSHKFLISSFVFVTVVSILFLWRFNYFGYLFPNTYYAKVSLSLIDNIIDGFKYIGIALINNPVLSISSFISIIFFKRYFNISVLILIPYLISLLVGGDHFGYSRIFQPFIIFNYLIIVYFCLDELGGFIKKIKKSQKIYLCFITLIFITLIPRSGRLSQIMGRSQIRHEWGISKSGFKNAQFFNTFFSNLIKYPSVGVITTGGFGYKYSGETIDLLGLNNTEMAHFSRIKKGLKNHGSFEESVFFKQLPDVLVSNGCNNCSLDKENLLVTSSEYLRNIEKSQEFYKKYSFVYIEYKNQNMIRFFSNKFLETLPPMFKVTHLKHTFNN